MPRFPSRPTPRQIARWYREGGIGCWLDHEDMPLRVRREARYAMDEAMAELERPLYGVGSLGAEIAGSGQGKRALLHKVWEEIDPGSTRGRQLTGDCVSWGCRGASDTVRAVQILLRGRRQRYIKRQATAGIYSGRGHTGAGASPARLSRYTVEIGTLLEQEYLDGKYDFREYEKYYRWGMQRGRVGMPDDLLEETKKHRLKTTSLVVGLDELRDLLFNGYGVHCGSSLGVSSRGDPVSRRQGSWPHDMHIVGYDDTQEFVRESVFLWDQSWGNWNSVSNIPDAWQPWGEGMFALSADDTWYAVKQRETWVFSEFEGFPATELPDHWLI